MQQQLFWTFAIVAAASSAALVSQTAIEIAELYHDKNQET